ncbi:MAG TPA: PilZ domain-containing protein [Pseudolabrys sp.]|nr:PilZ domain-containing protein [Pseudolabrys sp.]
MNSRSAFRYPTMREATVVLVDGTKIKCTVRDISTKGARLELAEPQKLPEQFHLFIHGQSDRFRCYCVWQKNTMAGVQYV